MGNSLFDQLKKTGLVDEKKAKKARQSQYKGKQPKAKKGTPKPVAESRLLAQQALAEKVERDRQLNQQKREEAERKAVTAQVRQLIETNIVKERNGDIAYNFSDANVVKCIHVSKKIHRYLSSGFLAIARLGDGYELVPMAVAEKIRQRDPQSIIQPEYRAESEQDEDYPYADYQIPDDLMW